MMVTMQNMVVHQGTHMFQRNIILFSTTTLKVEDLYWKPPWGRPILEATVGTEKALRRECSPTVASMIYSHRLCHR
jgi:hypothetical protein